MLCYSLIDCTLLGCSTCLTASTCEICMDGYNMTAATQTCSGKNFGIVRSLDMGNCYDNKYTIICL